MRNDINEEMTLPFKNQCAYMETTFHNRIFEIILDEGIREPSYYREVLSVIRNCNDGDLVKLIICNGGGRLDTAIMFRNAIAESEGNVVAIIEGDCHSAASMIALSAHGVQVKPYASMLVHNASYGTYNTAQNVYDHVSFTQAQTEKLIKEIYEFFLTPDEIDEVIRNREIWLTDEQIGERLDRMFEARAEQGCGDEDCQECGIDGPESIDEIIEKAVEKGVAQALAKRDAAEKKASAAKLKKEVDSMKKQAPKEIVENKSIL